MTTRFDTCMLSSERGTGNRAAPVCSSLNPRRRVMQHGVRMDEHDDDLASEVIEDAEEETDSFPVTEEEFEDEDKGDEDEEENGFSEDESEL